MAQSRIQAAVDERWQTISSAVTKGLEPKTKDVEEWLVISQPTEGKFIHVISILGTPESFESATLVRREVRAKAPTDLVLTKFLDSLEAFPDDTPHDITQWAIRARETERAFILKTLEKRCVCIDETDPERIASRVARYEGNVRIVTPPRQVALTLNHLAQVKDIKECKDAPLTFVLSYDKPPRIERLVNMELAWQPKDQGIELVLTSRYHFLGFERLIETESPEHGKYAEDI
jgi:hypothetical protein